MKKRGIEEAVLKLIRSSPKPLSTREISLNLKLAWHTADRYCLKLQIQNKIDSYTIGKSTAWFHKSG